MAAGKAYADRSAYRFLSTDQIAHPAPYDSAFELEESEVYGSARSDSPELLRAAAHTSRVSKKPAKRAEGDGRGATPSSLPVNVPDWSKILRGEYRENRRRDSLDDDSDGGGGCGGDGVGCGGEGIRVPPHEFLARTRIASFSVHEGRGRTLKGRDLSRVRNAIWEKTGFED